MQALLGGSVQAVDSDGIGPINAILRGGDLVIVAGLINKSLFKFVAQKEIAAPAQLRGNKDRRRQFRRFQRVRRAARAERVEYFEGGGDAGRRRRQRGTAHRSGKTRSRRHRACLTITPWLRRAWG